MLLLNNLKYLHKIIEKELLIKTSLLLRILLATDEAV